MSRGSLFVVPRATLKERYESVALAMAVAFTGIAMGRRKVDDEIGIHHRSIYFIVVVLTVDPYTHE